MKTGFIEFNIGESTYKAQVTISDSKVPHIYMVAYENQSNPTDKGLINFHDYCNGKGIEAGINNPNQQFRDAIVLTLLKGIDIINN